MVGCGTDRPGASPRCAAGARANRAGRQRPHRNALRSMATSRMLRGGGGPPSSDTACKTTMDTEKTNASLTTRTAWILFGKIVSFALSFALPLMLVRKMSQSEYGLYKQAFLVVSTAYTILPLGFGLSAFYFLPRETEERRRAVLFNILAFYFVMGAVAILALLLFPGSFANLLISDQVAATDPNIRAQIVSLAPLIGSAVFFWLFSSFLEQVALANQETKMATFFIIVAQFTKSIMLIVAAGFWGSVVALLYAATAQGVLQTIILLAYLQSRFPGFWHSVDFGVLKKQLLYALPFGMAGLLWKIQIDIHNYFVSFNFGQTGFAVYSVGVFQLPLLGILNESIASVMIPRMSYLQGVNDKQEIIRLWNSVARKLALFYFATYAALSVMSRDFIVALFTDQYLASIPIFLLNMIILPTSIFPLDPICRAYQSLGRFLPKFRIVLFVLLMGGLTYVTRFQDLRLVIGLVVAINAFETFFLTWKAAGAIGTRFLDLLPLRELGRLAGASLISAALVFVAQRALAGYGLPAIVMLGIGSAIFGSAYLALLFAFGALAREERDLIQSYVDKAMLIFNRGARQS